jgi:hypothetical protein
MKKKSQQEKNVRWNSILFIFFLICEILAIFNFKLSFEKNLSSVIFSFVISIMVASGIYHWLINLIVAIKEYIIFEIKNKSVE